MISPLYVRARPSLQPIFDHYQLELRPRLLVATGNISVDWFGVVGRFVASVWTVLRNNGDDAAVTTAVQDAALDFYDTVIKPAMFGQVSNSFIFTTVVDPLIKNALPAFVSGIVSMLNKVFRRDGETPATVPDSSSGGVVVTIPPGFVPY